MQFIKGTLYITLAEYSQIIGVKEAVIIKNISADRPTYSQIRTIPHPDDARAVLYEWESLPAAHQEAAAVYGGDVYAYARAAIGGLVVADGAAYSWLLGQGYADSVAREAARKLGWLAWLAPLKPQECRARWGAKKAAVMQWAVAAISAEAHTHWRVQSVGYLERLLVRYRKIAAREPSIRAEWAVSGRLCNQNTRKVDDTVRRLLMGAWLNRGGAGKPTPREVLRQYDKWRTGKDAPVDRETGELLVDVRQQPLPALSLRTVEAYCTDDPTRRWASLVREGSKAHNDRYRPHNHRRAPQWGLSKITMDDMMSMVALEDGRRVCFYKIFDVRTGALLGSASAVGAPDAGLVVAAMRDMVMRLSAAGLPMPAEVEVESHLNSGTEAWARLQAMFPFVTLHRNAPQAKAAERFINQYKMMDCVRLVEGYIGRYKSRKEWQSPSPDTKPRRYALPEVLEMYAAADAQWNAEGRWEALVASVNPALQPIDETTITTNLGEARVLTVRRSDYLTLTVGGEERSYAIPREALAQMKSNRVRVRWLPHTLEARVMVYAMADEGAPAQDRLLGAAERIEQYNAAKAERTERDEEIMAAQISRRQAYDRWVRERVEEIPVLEVSTDSYQLSGDKESPPPTAEADAEATLTAPYSKEAQEQETNLQLARWRRAN